MGPPLVEGDQQSVVAERPPIGVGESIVLVEGRVEQREDGHVSTGSIRRAFAAEVVGQDEDKG